MEASKGTKRRKAKKRGTQGMGFEGLFRAVALVGRLHLRGENTRAPLLTPSL